MKRYPQGILSTCCVPWNENGEFAEEIFRRGVRLALSETPLLYIFGTAGEGHAVTERQFDQIVAAFSEEMRQGNAETMVGVIHLSLATMIERIERARQIGVRQFQIALPGWHALSELELFDFFASVCGRFPDCQFLHYNLMRAKRLISGQEYGRLAELHPNFVGTKNTGDSLSLIRSLLDDAPQLQHFLSESGYVYGSQFGECGILASLIMNWTRLRELLAAGNQQDHARLTLIQREVNVVLRTLFDVVPTGRVDGAYDKLFQKMYDSSFPLRLLSPYQGSSDEEFRQFVRVLRERLPEWVPGTCLEMETGT